jgi:hypothetical protein
LKEEKEAAELSDNEEAVDVDINDLDKAAYAIPDSDEGYRKILKERFGHEEFKDG